MLQCGVYLIPGAGALTQQRLAALVNVHSTVWNTAGQEQRVSAALDTEYTIHRGATVVASGTNMDKKNETVNKVQKFQNQSDSSLKAALKVKGCNSNKALQRCWHRSLEAELFQLPLSTITKFSICFQTSILIKSFLAPWDWCSSYSNWGFCLFTCTRNRVTL